MVWTVLWWVAVGVAAYLTGTAIWLTVFPRSAPAVAVQFLWCSMTHQRWHVVQHERPTLTRLYCTKCGHVHLKMKRTQDRGKPYQPPVGTPNDPPRKGETRNGNAPDIRNGKG